MERLLMGLPTVSVFPVSVLLRAIRFTSMDLLLLLLDSYFYLVKCREDPKYLQLQCNTTQFDSIRLSLYCNTRRP